MSPSIEARPDDHGASKLDFEINDLDDDDAADDGLPLADDRLWTKLDGCERQPMWQTEREPTSESAWREAIAADAAVALPPGGLPLAWDFDGVIADVPSELLDITA